MNRRFDSTDVAAALSLLFILAVVGCIVCIVVSTIPRLSAGVCVDKRYDPPYTSMQAYTTGSGDNLRVNMHPVHHSASWSIQVSGTMEDGEPRAEWWSVGEGMYSDIQIGDYLERLPGGVSIVRKAEP